VSWKAGQTGGIRNDARKRDSMRHDEGCRGSGRACGGKGVKVKEVGASMSGHERRLSWKARQSERFGAACFAQTFNEARRRCRGRLRDFWRRRNKWPASRGQDEGVVEAPSLPSGNLLSLGLIQ